MGLEIVLDKKGLPYIAVFGDNESSELEHRVLSVFEEQCSEKGVEIVEHSDGYSCLRIKNTTYDTDGLPKCEKDKKYKL